jgi:hypothetical protein
MRRLRKYFSENTIQVMAHFTVSGQRFQLERVDVEKCMLGHLPDPVQEHYVVVLGRRFPPKQVVSCVTGLDRADFTTHHARRILRRLGFVAARAGRAATTESQVSAEDGLDEEGGPVGQADSLRPYVGQWVALAGPTEVLVAAETPHEVLAWLARHERRASYGMFRVPASPAEAEGAAPA